MIPVCHQFPSPLCKGIRHLSIVFHTTIIIGMNHTQIFPALMQLAANIFCQKISISDIIANPHHRSFTKPITIIRDSLQTGHIGINTMNITGYIISLTSVFNKNWDAIIHKHHSTFFHNLFQYSRFAIHSLQYQIISLVFFTRLQQRIQLI